MNDCTLLQNYITNFRSNLGYYPGSDHCFNYLQGTGMNEIQISNCIQQYMSNPQMNGNLYNSSSRFIPQILPPPRRSSVHYNNGNISAGVL